MQSCPNSDGSFTSGWGGPGFPGYYKPLSNVVALTHWLLEDVKDVTLPGDTLTAGAENIRVEFK